MVSVVVFVVYILFVFRFISDVPVSYTHLYFRPAEDEKNLVRNWMAIESSRTAENRMNVDAAKRYLRKDKKPRENELEKNQITMDEWLASLNGGG